MSTSDEAAVLAKAAIVGLGITETGKVYGRSARDFATDAARRGGAMSTAGCRRIVDAIDRAVRDRTPVVGVWHSGGARLDEGVIALDAVGSVFAAMVRFPKSKTFPFIKKSPVVSMFPAADASPASETPTDPKFP